MTVYKHKEFDRLRRREFHLTVVAAIFVLVLSCGEALFMYPLVFIRPESGNVWTMRVAFFGFCVLALLFVVYLLERQITVNKLKRRLLNEWERNIELRVRASSDMLQSMPDVNDFWDHLTMEFRRAQTMQQTLSLFLLRATPGLNDNDTSKTNTVDMWADTAKAMARTLRPTDSIYRLAPDLFGIVLHGATIANSNSISRRMDDELQSARSKHGCIFNIMIINYPENVKSSNEFESIVNGLLAEKEKWAVPEVG